jgi:hypothetical protein
MADSYNPHKAVYKIIPVHATANFAIKQLYINGHFCYVYKFSLIDNGLGIVHDITFYNRGFLDAHQDIVIEKKPVPLMKISHLTELLIQKKRKS